MAKARTVDATAFLAMQQEVAAIKVREAARDPADNRSAHLATTVYPSRIQTTPRMYFAEDARKKALDEFQPGLAGVLFDSVQLQAALKAAQELAAENSVEEYRAALSSVAASAEALHGGLRKENVTRQLRGSWLSGSRRCCFASDTGLLRAPGRLRRHGALGAFHRYRAIC